jgi:ankyrin repeat protein
VLFVKGARMKKVGFFAIVALLVLAVANSACFADANDDLYMAIKAKNSSRVKMLLASGANANAPAKNIPGIENYSPLYYAVNEGDTEIVKLLLDKGANANFTPPTGGGAPLMVAAQRDETEIVRLLLTHGADIQVMDKDLGHTALTIAATSGHMETVKLLLYHGAPVDEQSDTGATSLQLAVATTNGDLVRLLLDRHADVNHQDKYGRTPLMSATCPECLPEIARLLLARGADVNARDVQGKTAFYYAQAQANQKVIAVLVKAGANGGKMPSATVSKLTAADIQFLTATCKIERQDIDVIHKLDANTQQMLLSRIALRDCALLHPFISVRGYFRQLNPKTTLPMPPYDWVYADRYLTEEELKQYKKILEEAPL